MSQKPGPCAESLSVHSSHISDFPWSFREQRLSSVWAEYLGAGSWVGEHNSRVKQDIILPKPFVP